MANFKAHVVSAAIISISGGLLVYGLGMVDRAHSVLLMAIGMIGGILPDIDSDNSESIKVVFGFLALVFSGFMVFYLLSLLGVIVAMTVSMILYFVLRVLLVSLCKSFTVHRGAIHSPVFGLICGLILVDALHPYEPVFSVLSGIFLFFGFLVHLFLDETYSVDLRGAKLKKSFGTAFTLFGFSSPWTYIAMYSIASVLVYFNLSVFGEFIGKTEYINWGVIKNRMLIPDKVISE